MVLDSLSLLLARSLAHGTPGTDTAAGAGTLTPHVPRAPTGAPSASYKLGDRYRRRGGLLASVVGLLALLATAMPAGAAAAPNSADEMIVWTRSDEVVGMSDASLDAWKTRGVDGFVLSQTWLRDMGGTQDFTGSPAASLAGTNYDVQRRIRSSRIVSRLHARGMKAYLGFYMGSYDNPHTPFRPWFDDAAWSKTVIPRIRDLAGAAKLEGFDGLAMDGEIYSPGAGTDIVWNWNFPGNANSETATRAQVRKRGRQMMSALLAAYPRVDIINYFLQFPDTWAQYIRVQNGSPSRLFDASTQIDFWDGMSSVEGYSRIRFWDADFYKTYHYGGWDSANNYNVNAFTSLLSRRWSNWKYASSRFQLTPFNWIDNGPSISSFDDAKAPSWVAGQLSASRRWGMGGQFGLYSEQLLTFDYAPYVPGMQAASAAADVDTAAPTLSVTSPTSSTVRTSQATMALAGRASDDFAIRRVTWSTDRGQSGVAQLNWIIESVDDYAGFKGHMDWTASVTLAAGTNLVTIAAEDIHGLKATRTVRSRRAGSRPDSAGRRHIGGEGSLAVSGQTWECRNPDMRQHAGQPRSEVERARIG